MEPKIIYIAFENGEKVSTITSRQTSEDALRDKYPDADIYPIEYGEVQKMRAPITLVNGVVTEAPPPTAEEIAQEAKDALTLYTEESGLRRGCDILDPLTGEPSGDSSAPIQVIRQQTGQARNHLVYLKLDGTEEQKVSANNCQEVEENLSLVVAQTIAAVQSGTITTEAEITARITAVDMTY